MSVSAIKIQDNIMATSSSVKYKEEGEIENTILIESMDQECFIQSLPLDIKEIIFGYLPLTTLLTKASLVCKDWKYIINNDRFLVWRKKFRLLKKKAIVAPAHEYRLQQNPINENKDLGYPGLAKWRELRDYVKEKNMTKRENLIFGLIKEVKMFGNQNNIEILYHLQKHRNYHGAICILKNIFPKIKEDYNAFSMIAALVVISESTEDIELVLKLMSNAKCPMNINALTECLYYLASMFYFTTIIMKTGRCFYYRLAHVLYHFENTWFPNPPQLVDEVVVTNIQKQADLTEREETIEWTAEQLLIINQKLERYGRVKITGFAGTGRTTTLIGFAKKHPELNILYITPNKFGCASARERFPSNVDCQALDDISEKINVSDSIPEETANSMSNETTNMADSNHTADSKPGTSGKKMTINIPGSISETTNIADSIEELKNTKERANNFIKAILTPSDSIKEILNASNSIEEILNASNSIEEILNASNSVEEILNASNSSEESMNASDSNEEPMNASDYIREPMKASDSIREPMNASDSIREPMNASDSIREPMNASDSNEEPMNASDYIREPMNASDSIREPMNASDYIREPMKASDSIREPMNASDSIREPMNASDSNEEPMNASDYIRDPMKASDSIREPMNASDSIREPMNASDSIREPMNASDSIREPMNASDSIREPMNASDSIRKPMNASDSIREPMNASDSIREPMKASDSIREPMKASDSIREPMDASDSIREPMNASDSIREPMNDSDSIREPMNDSDSIREPMNDSDSIREPMNDSGSNEEPINDSDSSEEPINDSDSSEEPINDSDSREEPINDSDSEIDRFKDAEERKYKRIETFFGVYDYILVDDAEDCSPAKIGVLKAVDKPILFVECEHHQIIYFDEDFKKYLEDHNNEDFGKDEYMGWCKFYSPFRKISRRYSLTRSFRFGPEIARVADMMLHEYKFQRKSILIGGKQKGFIGEKVIGQLAIISTTLYYLAEEAIRMICEKDLKIWEPKEIKAHFIGGIDNLEEMVAKWVKNKKKAKIYVAMIREACTGDIKNSNLIFATVEECKGMEFDSVMLTREFDSCKYPFGWWPFIRIKNLNCDWDDIYSFNNETDSLLNSIYLAVTRAKKCLLPNEDIYTLFIGSDEWLEYPVFQTKIQKQNCCDCKNEIYSTPDTFLMARKKLILANGDVPLKNGFLCFTCATKSEYKYPEYWYPPVECNYHKLMEFITKL